MQPQLLPSGHFQLQCMLKLLLRWLRFSNLEAASVFCIVGRIFNYRDQRVLGDRALVSRPL